MATTYARPSYLDIIFSVKQAINENDALKGLSYDQMKVWILEAEERITRRVEVMETRKLKLVQNQEDYPFQDSTVPATGTGTITTNGITLTGTTAVGTGTITSSGITVTGAGTNFITQLAIGNYIIVGSQAFEIVKINSATSLTLGGSFSSDLLSATAFSYSTTKFTRELVSGSVIVSNAQTWTVDAVTDGYNATLVAPNATEAAANTFTVDTVVTELPTRMMDIVDIDRIESSFYRQPLPKDIRYVLTLRKNDLIAVYSQFNTPYVVSVWRDGNARSWLKVYPVSDADKQMTLYARVRIMPRLYLSDTNTTPIQLSEDYEYAIRMYLQSMTYAWLKISQMAADKMNAFKDEIRELNAREIPNKSLEITYR